MKSRKFVPMMKLRSFIVFFVLGILSQPVVAAPKTACSIDIHGEWGHRSKSIHLSIPITVSISRRILFIENTSPDCDITITIINANGKIVSELEMTAVNTAYMVISVAELPVGRYTLELRNAWDGNLQGNFSIE